ncbi:MAG: PaaI family thioesterase [Stagnimonas sp.]|nr:PaaI family thioesterase [Stagnimonas sp.]
MTKPSELPTANPAYVAAVQESVRTAPYPALIGMQLALLDFDRCRIELELGERHMQPFGIVHGGVLATLIDTATFWAGFLRLPDDCGMVNVDLKLNYLKAVARGRLRAEGRCLRPGRQISYTEASVYDETGELVAHGTSTLMALPGKGLKLGLQKFL